MSDEAQTQLHRRTKSHDDFLHLLLHTVSSVHVLDVIEEITDRVHVAEMLAVLVNGLQHLVESHSNL